MSVIYLPSAAEQIDRAAAAFGGQPTRVLGIPHRICPLGAHVDHQGGLALGRAVGALTTLAYEPSRHPHVRLMSSDYAGNLQIGLDGPPRHQPSADDPLRYVAAAIQALMRHYPVRRGMLGLLSAPAGGALLEAGLGSSASVLLAVIQAVADVNDLTLGPEELVECVRIAENNVLGIPSGILDQSLIVHGANSGMVLLDAATRATATIPDPGLVGDVCWLLIHSGISRRLGSTNYAERVAECRSAAARLHPGATSLSEVPPDVYEASAHRLRGPLARRAAHYFSEVARVRAGADAWQAGDFAAVGRLMNESCRSSIEQYQSGHPALIALHNQLLRLPGVYGSRFSGGGFGGFVIALAQAGQEETIAAALIAEDPSRRVFVAPEPPRNRAPAVAIVPAAGRGMRLRPLTDSVPKPLLPVAGEPTIVHILRSLAAAGVLRVVIITGHLGEQIELAVGDGAPWGLEVVYCQQQMLNGTAGAIQAALDRYPTLFEGAPWLVTAADYALPSDYIQAMCRAHRHNAADATIALKWFDPQALGGRSSSSFRPDGRIGHIIEKPGVDESPTQYVASLTAIFPPGAAAYFRHAAANAAANRGTEVPWTAAVNAMITDGYVVRGLELPAPAEFEISEQMESELTV